jgi:hypothetical protein
VATFHDVVKEAIRAHLTLVLIFHAYASVDTPWVIHALSHYTPIVIPHSEIAGTKPPYVCPGCFIHTYSNNMINRFHVQ